MYVVCSGADYVAAVPLWELIHSSLQHLKAKNPDVSDWMMWYFFFPGTASSVLHRPARIHHP